VIARAGMSTDAGCPANTTGAGSERCTAGATSRPPNCRLARSATCKDLVARANP